LKQTGLQPLARSTSQWRVDKPKFRW